MRKVFVFAAGDGPMADSRRAESSRVFHVFGAYALGAVLMGLVNVVALALLETRYPGVAPAYLRTCVGSLVAGLQEPVTSKLLPALGLLVGVSSPAGVRWLRQGRWRLAAVGGLTVGIIELGSKLLEGHAAELGLLGPVALHVLTGVIVGVAVFRVAGRDRSLIDAHVVILALGVAILLHVGWNRYLGFWLAGTTPC